MRDLEALEPTLLLRSLFETLDLTLFGDLTLTEADRTELKQKGVSNGPNIE